jgi:hypothetical protein
VIGAERFLREIKTIAVLQHPHILGLIDSARCTARRTMSCPSSMGSPSGIG